MIQHYIRFLEHQARNYVSALEHLFGRRDPRFLFGTIRKSRDGKPRTHFPEKYHELGGCVVDIHITDYPWDHRSPDQGPWQVAHECVHLLDPVASGNSTYLEEGLAVWFQNNPDYHTAIVRAYIERSPVNVETYVRANELVHQCMPQLVGAIKDIRRSGIRIHQITADQLSSKLPSVDWQTLEALCSQFPQ